MSARWQTPRVDEIDVASIRSHAKMIHGLAVGIAGKLVVAGYGEDPVSGAKLNPINLHFAIGDIDGMTTAVANMACERFRNVYTPLSVFRPDLPPGKKGSEQDVVAVLGVVGDFDDAEAARWAERLPLPPNYAIESSSGRFQTFHLFDKPKPLERAKAVATRLKTAAACDHGTVDMCHVWRVPGTLNWPNKKKVDSGRSRAPQPVRIARPWDGTLTDIEELDADLGSHGDEPQEEPRRRSNGAALPDWLAAALSTSAPEGERSELAFRVIRGLVEHGFADDEGADLLMASPAGERYCGDRGKALAEFKRIRQKGDGDVRRASLAEAPWPTPLGDAAYHGLAGKIVRAIEPETEADPASVLLQVLAAFGNVIGRSARYYVDGVNHRGNLFVVTVGRSAKGRKGTAWARAREVFFNAAADPSWLGERIMSGLSSGEGLIEQVRDPTVKAKKGDDGAVKEETVDEGVADKRLLIVETEFSRTLRVMLRTDNTLSAIMRAAWDGDDLHVLTRKSPLHATAPHVSMIAHTTVEDLRKYLEETDAANGFGNRYLYACAERSKLLPRGGDRDKLREKLRPLERLLKEAIDKLRFGVSDFAERVEREITWADDAARDRWDEFYGEEAEERPGMLGAITARGEAQAIRLTMLYALLDGAAAMRREHLEAAIAVWRYCLDSARHIFGDSLGDGTADTVLAALRRAGVEGLTRSALGDLFGRHKSSGELGRALALLARRGLIACHRVGTGGRPTELWRAVR